MRFLKFTGLLIILIAVVAIGLRAPLHGQTRDRSTRTRALEILGGRGSEMGVTVREVDEADVKREKLAAQSGAVIDEVASDGPAAKAGLRAGDVVVEFDGERVRSARQLTRLIQETPSGRQTKIGVMRAGKPMDMQVTPDSSSGMAWLGGEFSPERFERFGRDLQLRMRNLPGMDGRGFNVEPRNNRARLGVNLTELDPQLAGYFGVKEGVLVSSVDESSPAGRAGLKAGDVLTAINGRSVRNAADVRSQIGEVNGPGELTLTVMRDRKELTLKVALEEVERRTRRSRWTV